MKPHIVKVAPRTWNVVNFQECWNARIDSVLDANDWCVRRNTEEWLIERAQSFNEDECVSFDSSMSEKEIKEKFYAVVKKAQDGVNK